MGSEKPLVIREPVHGDMILTAEEKRLLDTEPMQRLRGIRQLGTAHLVYPGAQHTRFEHSLGTLHMTGRVCRAVGEAAAREPGSLTGIDPAAERVLRFAALLHDITHIPFGHNIEDQSGLQERHDAPGRFTRTVGEGEVGEVLAHLGVREQVLAALGADPLPVPPFWREILADTICPDILDYLARDSYYTGLDLRCDPRVLSLFRVDGATGHLFVEATKRGMLREDALSEVIRVLEARYYFSERVYYHHAKIAAGALVSRAVEEACDAGELAPADLERHTDDSLIATLAGSGEEGVAYFADLYRRRRLPKRAAVYPRYLNRELQEELVARFFQAGARPARRAWEEEVEGTMFRRTGCRARVILYCPRKSMQLKESAIRMGTPWYREPVPLARLADRVPRVRDLEESYRNLWKLYLFCTSPGTTAPAGGGPDRRGAPPGGAKRPGLMGPQPRRSGGRMNWGGGPS